MSRTEIISASLQDYLEAIYVIISEKGRVRPKHIASKLGVKAPSVTEAMKSLARSGYVNYKPYDVITLTARGFEEAESIVKKKKTLKAFFEEVLGSDLKTAESGACKVEYFLTDEFAERLVSFSEHIRSCPDCGKDIITDFKASLNSAAIDSIKV